MSGPAVMMPRSPTISARRCGNSPPTWMRAFIDEYLSVSAARDIMDFREEQILPRRGFLFGRAYFHHEVRVLHRVLRHERVLHLRVRQDFVIQPVAGELAFRRFRPDLRGRAA